jgi:hypothetical protein
MARIIEEGNPLPKTVLPRTRRRQSRYDIRIISCSKMNHRHVSWNEDAVEAADRSYFILCLDAYHHPTGLNGSPEAHCSANEHKKAARPKGRSARKKRCHRFCSPRCGLPSQRVGVAPHPIAGPRYATARYCTLNSSWGSVRTRLTAIPTAEAIAANSARPYLQENKVCTMPSTVGRVPTGASKFCNVRYTVVGDLAVSQVRAEIPDRLEQRGRVRSRTCR